MPVNNNNKIATLGKFPNAAIAQLAYSVNVSGELYVSGQYQGQNIDTTIGAQPPYFLFFSPSRMNVMAVTNVSDLLDVPDAQYLDLIRTVS